MINKLLNRIFPLIPAKGEKIDYFQKERRQSTVTPDDSPIYKWVKGGWNEFLNNKNKYNEKNKVQG